MSKLSSKGPAKPARRRLIQQGTLLGAAALAAPWVLRSAHAQSNADIAPYTQSKVNWRQAEGTEITVARHSGELLRQPDRARTAVRGPDRHQGALRQGAAGADPAEGDARPSSRTATYATHAADPMYYPLYVANKWVDPLDRYLGDASLTGCGVVQLDDILKAWRNADSVDGKPYGIPYDGEVTVQVYRTDLYEAKKLKPADTLDQFLKNAAAIHDPNNRMYGMALRGFAGAGQNMYIYPSLFKEFGGSWFQGKRVVVNSPEAVKALDWYVNAQTRYAPPAVRNWNWPDIADAFSQGTLGCYIDAHSSAAVLMNPEKSRVIGKFGFARWPKGPTGKRCTSIWNWGFPINAALNDKQKKATWLFISWAASAETQAAHVVEVRRPGQALGTQPPVAVARARLHLHDQQHRAELHRRRDHLPRGGHRRRLAPAHPAVARPRRHDGDRHPGGAGRPEEVQGSAGRGAGAHRPDREGLTVPAVHPAVRTRSAEASRPPQAGSP